MTYYAELITLTSYEKKTGFDTQEEASKYAEKWMAEQDIEKQPQVFVGKDS